MAIFSPVTNAGMIARGFKTVLNFPLGPGNRANNTGPQVNIPGSSSLIITSAFTASFWWNSTITPNSLTTGPCGLMFTYAHNPSSAGNILLKIVSGAFGGYRINTTNSGGTNGNFNNNNAVLQRGLWYHSVLTWNGTTVQLYTNNVADGSAGLTGSMTFTSADPIQLGVATYNGSFTPFAGMMAEIRWYSLAISASDVNNLFFGKKTSQEANLKGYWKGNEGRGSIAHDFSGNNNNGTLLTGAAFANLSRDQDLTL